MGASASRLPELEAAQAQVRRVTAHLQRATASLAEESSKLSSVQTEAKTLRQQAGKLQGVQTELADANKLLKSARREAHELPQVRHALKVAQEAEAAARQASKDPVQEALQASKVELEAELQTSRQELERVAGELKFAQQEQRSVSRMRKDLTSAQKELQAKENEMELRNAQLVAQANEALAVSQPLQHPVFGELLHDYGHKRLYRASPLTLWAGTLVWDRQRAFRQERAAVIATAKGKSSAGGCNGWPGSISVVEMLTADTGTVAAAAAAAAAVATGGEPPRSADTVLGAVIDGQHRLGAAHLLQQRGKLTPTLQEILVEVYPPMAEKKIGELFTEINRAEPVALVDFPEGVEGSASKNDNAVLTAAAEQLRELHPEMFKSSAKCRAPHVNVDMLRNELHAADVLGQHKLQSADALLAWLDAHNEALAARDDAAWLAASGSRVASGDALKKALGKARDKHMFLGMTWAWLHEAPIKPKE